MADMIESVLLFNLFCELAFFLAVSFKALKLKEWERRLMAEESALMRKQKRLQEKD